VQPALGDLIVFVNKTVMLKILQHRVSVTDWNLDIFSSIDCINKELFFIIVQPHGLLRLR
jgi:hypothetical protein